MDETLRSMTTRDVQPSLASTSMKSRPYPPMTMTGPVAEHDRPFAVYGHLSTNELFFECKINYNPLLLCIT